MSHCQLSFPEEGGGRRGGVEECGSRQGPGGQQMASGPPILGARSKCRHPALDGGSGAQDRVARG